MAEFYPDDILRSSRALYEEVKAWASQRDDVTSLGGWPVWEHVASGRAQQSRDVDLVMHTNEALTDFQAHMPQFRIEWRRQGRNLYNDCYHLDDPHRTIVVDVFLADASISSPFRGPKAKHGLIVKSTPRGPFTPDTAALVKDKLRTIPLRQRDVEDKRLKDFLDISNLLFHNKVPVNFRALAVETSEDRRRALGFLAAARSVRGGMFAADLEALKLWLEL